MVSARDMVISSGGLGSLSVTVSYIVIYHTDGTFDRDLTYQGKEDLSTEAAPVEDSEV